MTVLSRSRRRRLDSFTSRCAVVTALLVAVVVTSTSGAAAAPSSQQFAVAYGASVSDGVPQPGAGNLEVGEASDVYAFDATAGDDVILDVIAGGGGVFRWNVVTPSGIVLRSSALFTDLVLDLTESGTYSVTVSGATATTTGTYSFGLVLIPPAEQFAIGFDDVVSDGVPASGAGNVESPGAQDRYAFDSVAGQTIVFDHLAGRNVFIGWTLRGPDGSTLFASFIGDRELVLPATGTYELTLRGNGPDDIGTYSFVLLIAPGSEVFAISIGDTVSDGVPMPGAGDLEGPGSTDVYTFSGTAGESVLFDHLAGNNVALGWRLLASDGAELFDGFLGDREVVLPTTGTYSLVVRGNGPADSGIYSFRTAETVTAPPITTTTTVPTTTIPTTTTSLEALPPVDATRFVPLDPERILDTRIGLGAPTGKVPANGEISLTVAGRGGISTTGVTAVVMNVTANQSTGPGFVTAYPSGVLRPLASNLNVERADQTIPNLVTVAVGPDGKVNLYTSGGGHLIADVAGYYTPVDEAPRPGRFFPVRPTRILDTRPDPADRIAAGTVRELTVVSADVPAAETSAVVLNVTAVSPTQNGYLTVFPTGTPMPVTSNLNYVVGQNIPNQVIVPVGVNGKVSIYAYGTTHVVVDVAGGFTNAAAPASITGLFVPVTPVRALDTRSAAIVVAGDTVDVPVVATLAPPSGVFVSAVAMNVTAVRSTGPGFVTAYPGGTVLPLASNLNLERSGQTIANHVTVGVRDVSLSGLPSTGTVAIYSDNATHLVADLNGYYLQST